MDLRNSTVKTLNPRPMNAYKECLKNHAAALGHHHHHPVVVTYKECLKNYAPALGGHAVDGWGEFMPSPAFDPSDNTSLKCTRVRLHCNFHRRDLEETVAAPPNAVLALEYQADHHHRRQLNP